MKSMIFLLSAFSITLASYCNLSTKPQPTIDRAALIDTIIKDIPLDKRGNPKWYYKEMNSIGQVLQLQPIDNGVDSFELRLWFSLPGRKEQFAVINNLNSTWSASIYELKYNSDSFWSKVIGYTNVVKNISPKSGWNKFLNSLFGLNVLVLPESDAVDGYETYSHGEWITIEIGTRKTYRIYSYRAYDDNPAKEAKLIQQFVDLIKKEFY